MKSPYRLCGNFVTLYNILLGYIYKIFVDIGLITIPSLLDNKRQISVVVSLTSYGRRVSDCVVFYTVVSLLRQTVKPKHIILWLSKDEWNDNNLPYKIKLLKERGVEILFCDDFLSYKKLVPILQKYPLQNIITFDDDNIYNSDTIERMYKAHMQHPNDIICLDALVPIIKNGVPILYNTWIKPEQNSRSYLLFPVGWAGVLYPPNSLHQEIVNPNFFMHLCPKADDVWFWFCGLRKGTQKYFIGDNYSVLSFDNLYQLLHKGSALTHTNSGECQNDRYFKVLFGYFDYLIK